MRRGLAMIDIHGGCYIGDVVGLGKTFIGAELLRQGGIRLSHNGVWRRVPKGFGATLKLAAEDRDPAAGCRE